MPWQPPTADDLPTPRTFVYKTVDNIDIEADVYLPNARFQGHSCPIFLWIHGGGWMACSRKYINVPLTHEFLQRGFIVTSIDYRLIPEITFDKQLDDIRSAETWVRTDLSRHIGELGFRVNADQVLVGDASAGGHPAMMVPHLWQTPPLAILSFYAPANFTTVKPREIAIQNLKDVPPLTSEIIKAAYYDTVRTCNIPDPSDPIAAARSRIAMELSRVGGIGEFLAAGPTEDYQIRKPGSIPFEIIAKISPALLPLHNYPPLLQILGTADLAFTTDQPTTFADKLHAVNIPCETILVQDAQHGFDEKAKVGGMFTERS